MNHCSYALINRIWGDFETLCVCWGADISQLYSVIMQPVINIQQNGKQSKSADVGAMQGDTNDYTKSKQFYQAVLNLQSEQTWV